LYCVTLGKIQEVVIAFLYNVSIEFNLRVFDVTDGGKVGIGCIIGCAMEFHPQMVATTFESYIAICEIKELDRIFSGRIPDITYCFF